MSDTDDAPTTEVPGQPEPSTAPVAGPGPLPASEPVAVLLDTATPGIALAQAAIEAERSEPTGDEVTRNARERALAGHIAPDTVDLPEARIRAQDNDAALRGTGLARS